MSIPARYIDQGTRFLLEDPYVAPTASAFLWNSRMLLQVTARGFATAQFMQPEPAKYTHPPVLAAKTFMQPEQAYFAHHPGRFFYVRDDDTGAFFSAPFEPCRRPLDEYRFETGLDDIRWLARVDDLEVRLRVRLAVDDVVERWTVTLHNRSERARRASLIPFFPVGYASWMNISGEYRPELAGTVCSAVTPYQKVRDYFVQKDFAELTFLVGDRPPDAWEANARTFEGEGGLHNPDALAKPRLGCGDARYEVPACILQYRVELDAGGHQTFELLFGPARTLGEISDLRTKYFANGGVQAEDARYSAYVAALAPNLQIETPDAHLDTFVNRWLPRQIAYQATVHRLTTDPQTRNFLQDAMGVLYLDAALAKEALTRALAQQNANGSMPDGILLRPDAELKYINQIPHTDHCVWLVITAAAYLQETGDAGFLDEQVAYGDEPQGASVFDHVTRGLDWLLADRDARGLSFIAQGDWCDPMNMVGYKGKGVSAWLSQAVAFAATLWAKVCATHGRPREAARLETAAGELRAAINTHLWHGEWYGRGITDDGRLFGISSDPEASVFLNPQTWGFLCGAPDPAQRETMLAVIRERLTTPHGVALLDPPFTRMHEDIGRVTQKHPGSAENGSVYNHAAAFYAYALYQLGLADEAYATLRAMLPGPDLADLRQRGQLPTYIPNYYRGAHRMFPRTAGRSSHLVHTGTIAWMYRCLVEHCFGLRGDGAGLVIQPRPPAHWNHARAVRQFRGATIELELQRQPNLGAPVVLIDGRPSLARIEPVERGRRYHVVVTVP